MELELHQVELRYAALRRRDVKRERALLASLTDVGQQSPVVVVRESLDAVATAGLGLLLAGLVWLALRTRHQQTLARRRELALPHEA